LVSGGILIQPLLEIGKLTITGVIDTSLVILRVVLESWVSADLESSDFIGGGIELSNDQVVNVGNILSKLFPGGGKSLAVAAPWSVVLNEHILGLILDDLFPLLSNEDGEWLVLAFWNIFTLEVWCEVASLEVGNIGSHVVNADVIDVSVPDELEHVLTWVNEADAWHVFFGDSDELSETGLDALSDA